MDNVDNVDLNTLEEMRLKLLKELGASNSIKTKSSATATSSLLSLSSLPSSTSLSSSSTSNIQGNLFKCHRPKKLTGEELNSKLMNRNSRKRLGSAISVHSKCSISISSNNNISNTHDNIPKLSSVLLEQKDKSVVNRPLCNDLTKMTKNCSEQISENQTLDRSGIKINQKSGKCPFQLRPDKLACKFEGLEDAPAKYIAAESTIIEKSGINEKFEMDTEKTVDISTGILDIADNLNSSENFTTDDVSSLNLSDDFVIPEKLQPPPTPPQLFESMYEENVTENDNPSMDETQQQQQQQQQQQKQQTEEMEEQNTNSQPGERSESSESYERINKDYQDIYMSDDDGEDIDMLLEKPIEEAFAGRVILPEEGEVREKLILAHRGMEYFDVLPEGWLEVTHNSGLPIYLHIKTAVTSSPSFGGRLSGKHISSKLRGLFVPSFKFFRRLYISFLLHNIWHKSTRVCTFSRPYFIGPGSVRYHNVPISAIPCLHQRRVLKEVEEGAEASAAALQNALSESDTSKDTNGAINEDPSLMARLQAPGTKVQTVEDFMERQLDPSALHEYAKAVFKFKKIQTFRFNKWAATRNFHRQRKLAEAERLGKATPSFELAVGRPSLPSHVKLITVPAMEANFKPQHRGFFLNPHGKTSVSVLHEYVQKVLKSTINYYFSETRNSSMPYGCTARMKMNLNNRVLFATSFKEKLMLLQEKQKREQRLQENGEQSDADYVILGTGCGNSKKVAKLDAARNALKVLIPDIEFDAEGMAVSDKKEKNDTESEEKDALALFDMLPIEDSRIFDLSARAGQPSPYLLLQECLKRNATYGDTEIKLHSVRVKHQRHQFDMDVGKHRVSVICANKREGKQKASQAMLRKLHPDLDSWGALLRLYGHEAQQKQQEARKSRLSIIKLQGNRDKESSALEPNNAILEKLRTEMLKLSESRQKAQSEDVPKRPKLSATNETVNDSEAAQKSAEYAATHPDALSALRIDL